MSVKSKQEILQLLENGEINAAEAADMLNQSAQERSAESMKESERELVAATGQEANNQSMFRVCVRELDSGKSKVSVNIPVRMLKFGLKLGARFSTELEGLDYDEISEMMADLQTGVLVEVQDEESNEHVQVFIE